MKLEQKRSEIADFDFTNSDESYLPPLLVEGFSKWIEEAGLCDCKGKFILLDRTGKKLVDSLHEVHSAALDDAESALLAAYQFAVEAQKISTEARSSCKATVMPLKKRTDNEIFAYFAFVSEVEEHLPLQAVLAFAAHCRSCIYHQFERMLIDDVLYKEQRSEEYADKQELLLVASKKMNNQNDVSGVLSELLSSVEQLCESSDACLYLTQDYVHSDPRVLPLALDMMSHDFIAEAFLNSKPVLDVSKAGKIGVAVPLTGKQASYGILKLTVPSSKWDNAAMQMISLFADTAGSAFENAKLYEQSNMLIKELRLINEMTKRLNQSLRLKEIFQFATQELLSIFQADYCCLLQFNKESQQFEVMASNYSGLYKEKFPHEYGFSGIVYRTKEPLIISDYTNTSAVPSALMEKTQSRSLIASPIFIEGEVIGVILITHRIANFFSYENYKLLQVISTHIGLAIVNASLHAELRRMVITDHLTGLHTRPYLNEQIRLRQRKDQCGSLILLDVDHFKQVNDSYGHQTGDEILNQVSAIIKASIRSGDIAARWGGEELAVYLPQIGKEQAKQIAERIRQQVEVNTTPQVTVSCGVSEWTTEQEKISVEALFHRADMAMYEAKHEGRNRIVTDTSTQN